MMPFKMVIIYFVAFLLSWFVIHLLCEYKYLYCKGKCKKCHNWKCKFFEKGNEDKPMNNYERIKEFSFDEMVEFLEEIAVTDGDNLTTKACRNCQKEFPDCPYESELEPGDCRLPTLKCTVKYWLMMRPSK